MNRLYDPFPLHSTLPYLLNLLNLLVAGLNAVCSLLSVGTLRFLDISRQFTAHLFSPWMPSSARGKGGGPQRFTAIVLNV